MESFYGPSIPHLNNPNLLKAVKDEIRFEDQALSEIDNDTDTDIKQLLLKSSDEVMDTVIEEVLQEEDNNCVLPEEELIDLSNEAFETIEENIQPLCEGDQEVVWPLDDLDPVVIRSIDFHCLDQGQCLTDTIVDFCFKYQERKYKWLKGFHFFNSFFFRKLIFFHEEVASNGFTKIARWIKDVNIFNCDYIFLPILLR